MQRYVTRLGRWLSAHFTLELGRDLALLLFLGAWAAGLVILTGRAPIGPLMVLWGAWIVTFALLTSIGWIRLCGPMLLYDLLRLGRQRRYILIRTSYVVALLLLLTALYSYWTWDPRRVGAVTAPEMTRFAEMFFFSFMCAEFLAVLLLTPAYTAGAIAGEKDRHTLEFLLVTDLHKREIILSKLASRVASLAMIVLAGLPVLSFTQFFGGIDPDLLLTCFAVLCLTMVSLAALSILHSIYARRSRTAIVLTYISTAIYLGMGYLAAEYVPEAPEVAGVGFSWEWRGTDYSITVQSVVDAINAGNVVVALRKLRDAWKQNAALTVVLPPVVLRYGIFHALAAMFCTVWAVLRLRATAGPPPLAPQHHSEEKRPWWSWPRLENNPLLWKEMVVDSGFSLHRIARLLLFALALASFVPAVAACYNYAVEAIPLRSAIDEAKANSPSATLPGPENIITLRTRLANLGHNLRKDIQEWVKTIGTLVACLTLLAVAVRAAGSVSGERDRDTLDSLLTTPLNRDSILYSKWLASILAVRWTWLWLGLMWTLALGIGGISMYAMPLLIWAWMVYAMFAANLGLWFSTICRSTLRATIATLLTLVCVCFAHWLVLGCYLPFFLYSSGKPEEFPGWVIAFQKYGLTPPLTWSSLAFQLDDLRVPLTADRLRAGEGLGVLVAALLGICLYGVAASVLWKLASWRFRVLGIAQPLHQGLFPGKDEFFEQTEAAAEVPPDAITEQAQPVPMAAPVDEHTQPDLRGAVMVEEKTEEGKSGD